MISQAVCLSYLLEIVQGVHQPMDVYKIALFRATANLSKDTTVYSPTQEVTGQGYVAGGQALEGFAPALEGNTAYLDWTTDPVWPGSTITARGALIYNSSRGDKAVAVWNFGEDKVSTNGDFLVTLPAPGASSALVRLRRMV